MKGQISAGDYICLTKAAEGVGRPRRTFTKTSLTDQLLWSRLTTAAAWWLFSLASSIRLWPLCSRFSRQPWKLPPESPDV